MADLLETIFDTVVISVPKDFENTQETNYTFVKDVISDLGPLGGLYSLYKAFPDKAFFIIATDMPEVEQSHILNLLKNRDKNLVATCYKNTDGFVEPLFAIWENSASEIVNNLIAENKLSMRMILKNHKAKIIKASNEKSLININTESEKRDYLNKENF